MHELDAGYCLEQLGCQVGSAADAAPSNSGLSPPRLCEPGELAQGLRFYLRIDEKEHGGGADQGNGRKVGDGIVLHSLLNRRNDGVRHVGKEERVAVGRRLGGKLDAEAAARSGTIIDDNWLA